jgi:primosomal protein N' (replication factor Y) (superfamily II helicase)
MKRESPASPLVCRGEDVYVISAFVISPSPLTLFEFTTGTEERQTWFADVIVPLAIPQLFTYRIPRELDGQVQQGCRVIIPFGTSKILTGIVQEVHSKAPTAHEARSLLDVLDDIPAVNIQQLKLFQWVADYYMCTPGEVITAALPSGLKLSSESKMQLHPSFRLDEPLLDLSDKEWTLLEVIQQKQTIGYEEAARIIGTKSAHRLVRALVEKEAILLFEELKDRYVPKVEKRIRLTPTYAQNPQALEGIFAQLSRKPKQESLLLAYLQEVPVWTRPEANLPGVEKGFVKDRNLSSSALQTLIKNGVMEEFERIISRFEEGLPVETPPPLSPEQEVARKEIMEGFAHHTPILLHGITGSGKTQIFIDLIQQALENGTQVLYLVPEIALTTQIVQRLRKIFGSDMGVYHSRYSDNERVEVWKNVLHGKFSFVVGVRSAVFLPFQHLGLLIVDEEHETSYKQYDPAPRYHARDLALVLAQIHQAQVVLGSATPSMESYHNALQGKYKLVKLSQRFGEAQLPKIELNDLLWEGKKKTMMGNFSPQLVAAIRESLRTEKQVIIFQNRRGYAPYLTCEDCGWVSKCDHCSVSLTYHQFSQTLTCHYCGFREPIPVLCEHCGSSRLKTMGFGTEKLEEELQLLFPEARIDRMDLDTTRSKYGYEELLKRFENRDTDILVGTQMITKGLDFEHVNLVGVMDVDRMMHFPDFRATERSFQLVTQVSGRAGRKDDAGRVMILTRNVADPLFEKILRHDYEGFFAQEIEERKRHLYPPFTRLIRLTVKDRDRQVSISAADALATSLRAGLGNEWVLGPQEPLISRIRNQYLIEIWVKIPKNSATIKQVKERIATEALMLKKVKNLKSARVVVDVDPV